MRLMPVKSNAADYPMLSMFDDFVDRYFDTNRRKDGLMPMDIVETTGEYVVTANLPGISKENVSITTDRNQLIIEARQETHKEEKKAGEIIYSERFAGNYRRTLSLPESCDWSKIRARMEDGVLTLVAPKNQDKIQREIVIE
jgi:HSP20 family protein